MKRFLLTATAGRRGNATVISVIVLFVIGSMAGLVLSVTQRHSAEVRALADQNRAFFVAQSAINDVLAQLDSGSVATPDEGKAVSVGSHQVPEDAHGGRYWVDVDGSGSGTYTLTAHARAGMQEKAIEVVVEKVESSVYRNGLFAGNDSGDPSYVLELGGRGGQADWVGGDIYSGGSVNIGGDAEVAGTIRAAGTVIGNGAGSAETGQKQAVPDLQGMNYELIADIKVAQEFSSGSASYTSDSAGGSAWQLPESNPAHIFRKNPSDRNSESSGTVKDDYYLEDPYETVRSDSSSNGSNAYGFSLSGVSGEPGVNSNQKVFFIDGNLWIHNYRTMSLKLKHSDPNGVQVTFVVKGNVYFSDNLFYSNESKDAIAFIAMEDADVADSGNIYFGDPEFGTLERMQAYMYAENNFHDVNLTSSGSAVVELLGNMTAGNQIVVDRDYTRTRRGRTTTYHSKLVVDFDERLADGDVMLPGLPKAGASGKGGFTVLSWREVEN